jgi:periplasmic protein TonB
MKQIALTLTFLLSLNSFSQGECLIAYISDHHVINETADTVVIWVNNKNQEGFSTAGPTKHVLSPGENKKICSLEWAEEFREPTFWYVFKNETEGLTNLCEKKNWIFKKKTETTATYTLRLTESNTLPCIPLADSIFFADNRLPFERVEDEIYDFPDVEAEFPGGMKALMVWVESNIQYPSDAHDMAILGRVYVEFVVEKDGKLTNMKVLKSPHELLSKESIRLIETMPNWKPSEYKGEVVRSRYRLPISFRLR